MKKTISIFIGILLGASILSINAFAAPKEIQGSANKTNATHITYNIDYVDAISVSGQEDWFKFTTKDIDGYYEIVTKNISVPTYNVWYSGLAVEIYSIYDELLLKYDIDCNKENMGNVKLEKNTTYYVKIYSPNLDKPTGNYRFNLVFHKDAESDIKKSAKKLKYMTPYSSDICAYGGISNTGENGSDIDWFKFTASKRNTLLYINNKNVDFYNVYYEGLGVAVYTKYDELLYSKTLRKGTEEIGSLELEVGEEYYIKVFSTSGYKGNYSIKVYVETPVLTSVKASLYGHDDVQVKWDKVSKANGYKVYYKKASEKAYTYKGFTTKNSINFTNLADNQKYYFRVVPCIKLNNSYYSGTGKTITCSTTKNLTAPAKVTAKLYGHDDVKLSWSKVSGATAYKVYYKISTSKSYIYKGTIKSTSMKIANLADGKKYTFKVVPCTYVNGSYFVDNSYKTAYAYTLKKMATPKFTKYNNGKVKVSFTNIAGESGYQISKSTSKTGTSIVSTYATTSGKSKVISATKGKTYYYKIRAYKVVNGKKIYGPWSAVKSYKLK